MGQDFTSHSETARAMAARADAVLGSGLTDVMFNGPIETLTRTSFCQPALYLHGLMALKLLQERVPGLEITACAGLSLGEFTAHAAAGTFSFEDGLQLVAQRGKFMDEACAETQGAMAAMIGGEESAIQELAAECDIDVANYNSIGQIVLSGSVEGVEKAIAGAKAKGIRMAKALTVAGAYHSRLMTSAREKLAAVLAGAAISSPRVPVIANFTAQPASDPAEIRRTLEDQVTGSVRWTSSMQLLLSQRHTLFLELGPGGVLAGLMGRIDKAATVLKIEDLPSLDTAVAALQS